MADYDEHRLPPHPDLVGAPKEAWCHLSAYHLTLLDQLALALRPAWPDAGPMLVGSVLLRPNFRDVDVRVVFHSDDAWAAAFPGSEHGSTNARAALVQQAISAYWSKLTGLPIDFQFQSRSKANRYQGQRRHMLGVLCESAPVQPLQGAVDE